MKYHARRPANVGAAAVLIGGTLIVALPQYALSVVQLVAVAVAVSAGWYVLERHVPHTGWISPFKWWSPFNRMAHPGTRGRSPELDTIRSQLSGWRRPMNHAAPLPQGAVRLMKPMIAEALDLETGTRPPTSVRSQVSPLAWAVLTSPPLRGLPLLRSAHPHRREVAETVGKVLDELDGLRAGSSTLPRPTDPDPNRAP